jgi:hypothetical protein
MKADCDGVAGFFEDLPVLMFVLTGVFIVVAAGVFASNALEAQRMRDRLDGLAESLVNKVVLEIEARLGGESLPTVSALSNLNLSHLAVGVLSAHRCSIAVIERYPEVLWLAHWSDEASDSPIQAVGAARLIDALDEHLMVVVVEVRTVVW